MARSLTWLFILAVFPISSAPERIGYNGTVNTTVSGKVCQMWDSQEPHHTGPINPYRRPHSGLEQNFCRTAGTDPCPWCYTTDPSIRWEHCFICDATSAEHDPTKSTDPPKQSSQAKVPTVNPRGNAAVNAGRSCAGGGSLHPAGLGRTGPPATAQVVERRGVGEPRGLTPYIREQVNMTISEIPCQRWDSQTPHYHALYRDLDGNFCQGYNEGSPTCPWCYTIEPGLRYDYCFDCSPERIGYNGTVNTTVSGKVCQMWDSQEPHRTGSFNPYWCPHSGLEQNFCRTPDSDPCPWCYTTDPSTRWEHCFICDSTSVPPASTNSTEPPQQTSHAKVLTVSPRGNAAVNAGRSCAGGSSLHPAGLGRTGPPAAAQVVEGRVMGEPRSVAPQLPLSTRRSLEKTCQMWDSQEPHRISFNTPYRRPHAGLEQNFCRTPDSDPCPWCYTMDPTTRWEHCFSCGANVTGQQNHWTFAVFAIGATCFSSWVIILLWECCRGRRMKLYRLNQPALRLSGQDETPRSGLGRGGEGDGGAQINRDTATSRL
ncbi:LPA [Branchiostoma lanceolatum]|uniref:LPA protein n=1 Tax=Branchiostoma lanceolatum TaxID=7740 RepID=A0A8K0ELP4_BRALA|nr:LPA [Branchiostoma lanceolatum]